MDIPAHVQAATGCGAQIGEEELANAVDVSDFIQDAFGLSGQEFSASATLALSGNFRFEVITATRPTRTWRYLELSKGGTVECTAICIPDESAGKPSTAAGQMLAAAWFLDQPVVVDAVVKNQTVVSCYAATGTLSKFSSRLVREWSEVCPFFEGSAVPPVWVSGSQLGIASDARINGIHNPALRFEELFLEAISEVKTKWRFLSTYRVLEHGYLSEVFQTLQAGFFASPKESISAASESLESEFKQFLALVEAASLQNQFETFYDEFEKAKSGGNRFAVAIDRSITKSGQVKQAQGKWQKGVLIYYKIRCAIVHAGIASPMFDAYPDGPECLEVLMPTCELLMLQFLGLTVA